MSEATRNLAVQAVLGMDHTPSVEFWRMFRSSASFELSFGFSAALMWCELASILRHGRRFGAVANADRDAMMTRWNRSSVYLIRQLVIVIKLVACFSFFSQEES